jgi:hypothetical protein
VTDEELKALREDWAKRLTHGFHEDWGGPNQQAYVREVIALIDELEKARAELNVLREGAVAKHYARVTTQRNEIIGTLAAVAKLVGVEDWTALAEDPSVVLLPTRAARAVAFEEAAGGYDGWGETFDLSGDFKEWLRRQAGLPPGLRVMAVEDVEAVGAALRDADEKCDALAGHPIDADDYAARDAAYEAASLRLSIAVRALLEAAK